LQPQSECYPLGTGSAQIRLSIEQGVQRLFHRAPYDFSQVRLNLALINLNYLAQLRHFRTCFCLDAVRRRLEGAKARALFEEWLGS